MTPAHSVGTKDGTSVVNPKSALKEAVELADALVNELLPDQGSGGSWAFALALKLQASVASQAATLEAMASALETMRREFCNPMVRRALDETCEQAGETLRPSAAADLLGALQRCRALFSEIRNDWTDPRADCREGLATCDAAISRATGGSQ